MKPATYYFQTINGGVHDYVIEVKQGVDDQKYLSITRAGDAQAVMVLADRFHEFMDAIIRAAGAVYHDAHDAYVYQAKIERIRAEYSNAYQAWSPDDDQLLIEKHHAGCTLDELAELLQRQPSAIRSRLAKLKQK